MFPPSIHCELSAGMVEEVDRRCAAMLAHECGSVLIDGHLPGEGTEYYSCVFKPHGDTTLPDADVTADLEADLAGLAERISDELLGTYMMDLLAEVDDREHIDMQLTLDASTRQVGIAITEDKRSLDELLTHSVRVSEMFEPTARRGLYEDDAATALRRLQGIGVEQVAVLATGFGDSGSIDQVYASPPLEELGDAERTALKDACELLFGSVPGCFGTGHGWWNGAGGTLAVSVDFVGDRISSSLSTYARSAVPLATLSVPALVLRAEPETSPTPAP